MSDEQARRTAIEAFYKAFSSHDVDLLRTVVTPDWEYIPRAPGDGARSGPDQMLSMFKDIAAAIPDMHIEILDLLISGDRVGVRAQVTGTQTGTLLGIEATSKPVKFAIHSFHEIRGTLISKTWHLEDWLSMFRQIGQMPQSLEPR